MTTQPKPCPDMPAEVWVVRTPDDILLVDEQKDAFWMRTVQETQTRYVRADTRAADTVEDLLNDMPDDAFIFIEKAKDGGLRVEACRSGGRKSVSYDRPLSDAIRLALGGVK